MAIGAVHVHARNGKIAYFIFPSFLLQDYQNLKGSADCEQLNLNIPVYIRDKPGKGSLPLIVAKNYPEVIKQLENLEIDTEKNDFSKEAYLQKLKLFRDTLTVGETSLSQDVFLVPVRTGLGDVSYRIADVPIKFGEKYILFLLVKPSEYKSVSSSFWDIYPLNGRVELLDMLNITRKEGSSSVRQVGAFCTRFTEICNARLGPALSPALYDGVKKSSIILYKLG